MLKMKVTCADWCCYSYQSVSCSSFVLLMVSLNLFIRKASVILKLPFVALGDWCFFFYWSVHVCVCSFIQVYNFLVVLLMYNTPHLLQTTSYPSQALKHAFMLLKRQLVSVHPMMLSVVFFLNRNFLRDELVCTICMDLNLYSYACPVIKVR